MFHEGVHTFSSGTADFSSSHLSGVNRIFRIIFEVSTTEGGTMDVDARSIPARIRSFGDDFTVDGGDITPKTLFTDSLAPLFSQLLVEGHTD